MRDRLAPAANPSSPRPPDGAKASKAPAPANQSAARNRRSRAEEAYALPLEWMPNDDHAAIIARLCQGDLPQGEVEALTRSWRLLLGSIRRHEPANLELPIAQRLSATTADYFARDLKGRLSGRGARAELYALRRCASHLKLGVNLDFLFDIIRRDVAEARAAGTFARAPREVKGVKGDLPGAHGEAIQRLDGLTLSKDYKIFIRGEYRRWLGALERGGVAWRQSDPRQLLTPANVRLFEAEIGRGAAKSKIAGRLNAFGCGLSHLFSGAEIHVEVVFAHCRRLRRGASQADEPRREPIDKFKVIPEEERRRLEFALREEAYEEAFTFNGASIALAAQPASEATTVKMWTALGAFHAALALSAPDLRRQPVERRDYVKAVGVFIGFFSHCQASTQATRLSDLRMALNRIVNGLDLAFMGPLIAALNAEDADAEIVVPALAPRQLKETGVAIMRKLHGRLTDLKHCPTPYRELQPIAEGYRNALIVALLADTPLRLRTLSMLTRSGGHLDKKGLSYVLEIPAELMKSKRAFFGVVGEDLTIWIDIYYKEIRPMIAPGAKSDALWPSRGGQGLSGSAFQTAIPALVLTQLGVWLPVHHFRRVVATYFVFDDDAAAAQLQHRDKKSLKHYQSTQAKRHISRASSLSKIGFDSLTRRAEEGQVVKT